MKTGIRKESIPWAMAAVRAALGPALIAGVECGWNGFALAGMVVTALLSDIFDGVLARRWSCDTAAVRLFDSMADTFFYLCVAVALWVGQPQIWRDHAGLLAGLLVLEAMRFGLDFAKFGKPASYHSYLAKTWGLVMAVAVVMTFATGHAGPLVSVALWLGIVCNLEGLAMSMVLPVWCKDVKGIFAALRLREGLREQGQVQRVASLRRRIRAKRVATTAVLVLVTAMPAFAVEPGHAVYAGGTTGLSAEAAGVLDTSAPTALTFRYTSTDGKPRELGIDYKIMRSYSYRDEVAHHLGVLPAIAVGLLVKRERQYFFTVSYGETGEAAQVAIFEVSKRDVPVLRSILDARMPKPCPVSVPACVRVANPKN